MSHHFTRETTGQEVVDLLADNIKDRVVVVTGPSVGGIGYETARAIATKAPKLLILAGRDENKLKQAEKDILAETPGANIANVILDLNSLTSVRTAAAEINKLGDVDVLINNAAIMMCPEAKTADGIESQFGTNYVAPWLLTNLLIPSMLRTSSPRIVFVSSTGHRYSDIRWDDIGFTKGYDNVQSYGQSKTASILNALELAQRYPQITSISLHPGAINTKLQRHVAADPERLKDMMSKMMNPDGTLKDGLFFKTIPQGASTTLTAAFDPRMSSINGFYLADCQPAEIVATNGPSSDAASAIGQTTYLAPYANDKAAAKRLWALTEELVGEKF